MICIGQTQARHLVTNIGGAKKIWRLLRALMGEGEVIRLQWEEMSGMDKGTARLVLVTDSKSLQEACQTDNQLKDKRTAIDMAVLRRSVEMNIYSIMWRPGKTQLADPLTKQGACCDRLRHALTTGQVSIAF